MAISFVTSANNGGINSSVSAAATLNSLAVNDQVFLVINLQCNASGTIQSVSSISDSHNTWTLLGSTQDTTNTKQRTEVWTTKNTFAGNLTVTVTITGTAANGWAFYATAFRGVDGLGALTFNTNYTATDNAPTITKTVSAGDYMLLLATYDDTTNSWGAFTGYTGTGVSAGSGSLNANAFYYYQSQSTSGSISPTLNNSSNKNWALAGVVLQGSVGGTITTNLTKASLSLAGTAGLAINGTPQSSTQGAGTPASLTTAVTTTAANCLLVAVFQSVSEGTASAGLYDTVNTMTDTHGLTWTRRTQKQYNNTVGGSDHWNLNTEIWWAKATTAQSYSVTASITNGGAATHDGSFLGVFAVSGVQNFTNPFDGNSSLPGLSDAGGSGTSQTMAAPTISTSSSPTLIFSIGTTADGGTTVPGTGTSQTALWTTTTQGTRYSFSGEYIIEGTTESSFTPSITGSQFIWTVVTDAISGAPASNTTGTISQALTKVSLSGAGWTTVTGTVTTALTKASQLAADKEIFTGTITTRLTQPSQSLSGAEKFTVNAMTTNLSKLTQSLSGKETFTGTMTTTLTKVSQLAQAPGNLTGTITTSLHGVQQHATDIEEFIGTITTNLGASGVQILARTFEIFTGTITSNLSFANVAQSLVAEEDFIGRINTRLGNTSGQTIGNVVEAEVIIEGPIEMQLDPFRPLILGAQLGTPGQGKWFSYRYMDR